MLSNNKTKNSSEGTFIGSGVKLVGSLQDEGPITINGQAKGDIASDTSIFIGENAHVEGPITAKQVTVCGIVEGEVRSESLEIAPTGKISGKIDTKILIVKPGALFAGQCKMTPEEKEQKENEAEVE